MALQPDITGRRKTHTPSRLEDRKIRKVSIRKKTIYRIKAKSNKGRNVYFKIRTKNKEKQVKRFATLMGFTPERITI